MCLVPAIEDLQKTCENVACALDGQRHIARFLGAQRNDVALIRPDRHVLGTFHIDREQAFVEALREHFLV
jgi:hypothetical protein